MAEIKGDSAEAVALELLVTVARAEGVHLDKEKADWSKGHLLSIYQECLAVVKGGYREALPGNIATLPARPAR